MAGTKTIKSAAGDYSSVAGWESGEQGNLSGVGEVKGVIFDVNTTTSTIIAGSTNLSASDFRHLTTDSTTRHAGKWNTAKTNFQFNSLATVVFEIQEAFFQLDYCQLKNTHATSPTGVIKITNVSSVRIEQCITATDVAAGGDDNSGVQVNGASALLTKIRNHVSHGMRNGIYGDTAAQTTEIDNAATVACTKGIRTVASAGANMTVKNSYSGGNTNDYDEGGGASPTWSFTTCMCSQNLTLTGVTKNIAYSTANFTNVTVSTQDLHLVSGSALINVGTDLSATFTIDINGATRPTGASTWDVGPDEFVAAAAGVTYPQLERYGHRGAFRGMLH